MSLRTAAVVVLTAAVAGLLAWFSLPGRPIPKAVWEDPVTRMRFRLVQPARFRMGTPPDEHLRESQEVLHHVVLTKAYYLGEAEVSQAQWMRIMGANPSDSQECGPACPVAQVTWFAVQQFISKLNAVSVPGFRLPTEAEWEFACRAGGEHPFGVRATLSSYDANINGNYPYKAPTGPHRRQRIPPGRFPPNPFGLFDMSGNVWEWTEDEHCPYPDGEVVDPVGSCGNDRRVIRGGSWAFDGGSARCGVRFTHRPQDKGYSLGVRLAHDTF